MNRIQQKRREALIEQRAHGCLGEAEALELDALNADMDAEIDAEHNQLFDAAIEQGETQSPWRAVGAPAEDAMKREHFDELWKNVRIALKRAARMPLMREVAVEPHQFTPPLTLIEIAMRCPPDLAARVDPERERVIFEWSGA